MADGFKREASGIVRRGIAAAAAEDGASSGDAATIGPDGELLFAAAGSGSQPVWEAGYYSGGQVAAGNRPPWTILDSGTEVLDRTNPIQPVAIKDGLYIISAEIGIAGAVIPADCSASLIFDYDNDAALIVAVGVQESSGFTYIFLSGQYVLAAGEKIRLSVNTDPDADTVELRNALAARIGPA